MTETKTKTFHIGDVLSLTTGKLLSPKRMGGVYEILNWMTGDDLMTHQLPRAMDECEDSIKAQFPQLVDIDVPEIEDESDLIAFLADASSRFGEQHEVSPLAAEDHTRIDPIQELVMMRPDMPVVAVVIDDANNTGREDWNDDGSW